MICRHCSNHLGPACLDLGTAPPSNAFLRAEQLSEPEIYYPLKLRFCEACYLLQTEDFNRSTELFTDDYVYFSSVSSSWLEHAQRYARAVIHRLGLSSSSKVVEIASNDGYLLKNFLSAGIPCLGVEPTASTAQAAERQGIRVIRKFFGQALAGNLVQAGEQADLIVGNNVFAHVPEINDFTQGLAILLKPEGTITLEFPHLLNLVRYRQFDTVYHEHYSYLSLHAVQNVLARAQLRIYDVEQLPTHGGSLRVFGCHVNASLPQESRVDAVLQEERVGGLLVTDTFRRLQAEAEQVKLSLLEFLVERKRAGRKVAAYGAAAKGNTLLNFCGIKADLLPFVFDAASSKQGKFLPGSRVPVLPPSELTLERPEDLLLLPWNLRAEVLETLQSRITWPMNLVTAIPELRAESIGAGT